MCSCRLRAPFRDDTEVGRFGSLKRFKTVAEQRPRRFTKMDRDSAVRIEIQLFSQKEE
jgi:hypothetical protein